MVSNQKLYYYQEKIFDVTIIIVYLLIFISFFGIYTNAYTYLTDLNFYLRIYVCLFLIWRFNPFRKIDIFTNLDRKIAFNAGIVILTTSVLNKYIDTVKQKIGDNSNINNIKGYIDKIILTK
jgi:hypothetical protein